MKEVFNINFHNHEYEHCHEDECGCHEHHHEHKSHGGCSCGHCHHEHEENHKVLFWRLGISSVLLVFLVLLTGHIKVPFSVEMPFFIELACFLVPFFIAGYDILCGAIKNILHGELLDEEFLMAIATIGALAIGEYPEATFVMIFYQIGEFFSDYASEKTRDSVTKLMDISPEFATIKENGEFKQVRPESVKIGTLIYVKPGERIPLDGVIVEGNSALDTSALTGESLPQEVCVQSEVYSGSINLNSLICIRTSKEYKDSAVSKILELVEQSESKKSRSENFITKFARVYTPCVVGFALALAIIPSLVQMFTGLALNDDQIGTLLIWKNWIHRALIFLVVSCPCALVISVPLSFFVGIGESAKRGILVKGSNYLESLSKAKICVFDKTGTLTKGSFIVDKILKVGTENSELEILEIAAACESASTHPISISIVDEFKKRVGNSSSVLKNISDVKERAGFGVCATVEGKKVACGNKKLMDEENVEISDFNLTDKNSGTIVYISVDGKLLGAIIVKDQVKAETKKALLDLKNSGISKNVMLTGDKEEIALEVSKDLVLDQIFAELLPQNKVEAVEKLLSELGTSKNRGKLVFCGDGINDAPVLTRADIGVAMGSLGSDAAIEASDIVIMDDNIAKIPLAIKIAKSTNKIAKENIGISLGVKIAVLVLGALGIANMWLAIFADVGVCVLATLNAIRAGKVK
ncbi:MAG: heavy metal translocating P-type ATPase [Treponemataceae bacterium]|nr:heavy metal translocating P-type ATPase [Spirochaetales bacterium]MDY6031072.1 heavy metal translocating P-type ATPase [Treponemataceae bacterium]